MTIKYLDETLNEAYELPASQVDHEVLERIHRELTSGKYLVNSCVQYKDAIHQFNSRLSEIDLELYHRRNNPSKILDLIYGIKVAFKPDNVKILDSYQTRVDVAFLNTILGDITLALGNNPFYGYVVSLGEYKDSNGNKHLLKDAGFEWIANAETQEICKLVEFLYPQSWIDDKFI